MLVLWCPNIIAVDTLDWTAMAMGVMEAEVDTAVDMEAMEELTGMVAIKAIIAPITCNLSNYW